MSTIRLTNDEKKAYLSRDPKIADVLNNLQGRVKLPKSKKIYQDIETAVAIARKFNEEVVKPIYKKIDLEATKDPNYLCWDYINKANEWGLFTLFMPKMMGGKGVGIHAIYFFLEEIASVCPGLSIAFGGHWLGWGAAWTCNNMKLFKRICDDIVRGEKTGNPCLCCAAMTEPEAGTDTEEIDLIDKARIGSTTKKIEGGYVISGRKIFVTGGHFCTWHITVGFLDKKKRAGNAVCLAVHKDSKGFSYGRLENKMGQKAQTASELVFEDCFVPKNCCCIDGTELPDNASRERRLVQHMVVDLVISCARVGVSSFGLGAARGAYETALQYARTKKVDNELLINHQWAQMMLSEMYKNINTARATFMEAIWGLSLYGIFAVLYSPFLHYVERFLPRWYFKYVVGPFLRLKAVTWLFRKINFYWRRWDEFQNQTSWASICKLNCGDIGVQNSQMAIELMGIDGCRHDIGAEKYLRDAKLVQIYEGTQQLQRLNIFNNQVARTMPEVKVFE